MNSLLYMSFSTNIIICIGNIPRYGTTGSYSRCIFNFDIYSTCLRRDLGNLLFQSAVHQSWPPTASHPSTVCYQLDQVIYLKAINISVSVNILLIGLPIYLLLVLFLSTQRHSLHVWEISPLSMIKDTNTFSQSVFCFACGAFSSEKF